MQCIIFLIGKNQYTFTKWVIDTIIFVKALLSIKLLLIQLILWSKLICFFFCSVYNNYFGKTVLVGKTKDLNSRHARNSR